MGIRDQISALFNRGKKAEPTTADEIQQEIESRSTPDILSLFETGKGRTADIQHSREIYKKDPRAKQILQTVARDATKSGFQIETDNAKAKDVADALVKRLKLRSRLDDWVRLAFRDGDEFLQLAVNRQRLITDITRKPTLNIRRHSNDLDRFDDPLRAFWYSTRPWQTRPDKDTIWMAEWEIIHARWDHDEGERYGVPLLAAGQKAYKRLDQGELDVAVRRKTRAGLKYIHKLDTSDPGAVAKYKSENKAVLDNPFAAVADLFMNGQGDVNVVQGDANLGELTDIRHHMNTWWLNSPAPMAILGYGQDIDFSVIGHQKEQYDESLDEIWGWVVGEFIEPLLERQWLMLGILPDQVEYTISRPPKKKVTPEDIRNIVEAAVKMQLLGIQPDIIATIIAPYLGVEPDMLLPEGGGNIDPERLATIATSLAAGMTG